MPGRPAAGGAAADRREEIRREQRHIDRAYAVLDALREGAAQADAAVVEEDESAGGTFQVRFDRERANLDARRRVAELRWGDPPLVFGRIDRVGGERFHIGRVGVFDADADPLVIDWRTPMAEGFYRATHADPMGLERRRAFHCRKRRLLDLDDTWFGDEVAGDHGVLVGEAALLAALAAPRDGRLRDAVATVQAEQDEVIRAPFAGITIVQGGAGTGKTVVALHRAAYLLYTEREVLDSQGVLILGPNRRFLDYVRDVLPALGEHDARLGVVADLHPGVDATALEHPAVAEVKAGLAMVDVVRRAVRTRQRPRRARTDIPVGRFVLKIPPEVTESIIAEVRGLAGTHNERQRFVVDDLADWLYAEFRRRNVAATDRMRDEGRAAFGDALAQIPAFGILVAQMWPLLTPQMLLHDLFGSSALLRVACRGVLDDTERDLLARPRSRSEGEVAWTDADVPLLAEAHALLGPLPRPPSDEGDPDEDIDVVVDRVIEHVRASMPQGMDPIMEADLRASVEGEVRAAAGLGDPTDVPPGVAGRAWGSVLIDEAQDLSPMAWRTVVRLCPNQAMTIVGDLAQGTEPWSPDSWDQVVEWMAPRHAPRRHDLHVNYRTPIEIMGLAAPFAADPSAARAVRSTPRPPTATATSVDGRADALRSAVEDLAAIHSEGRVAVIAPEELRAPCVAWLADLDPERVQVHTPRSAKGLEYDGVVVVEPAAMATAPAGRALLYIALTRATADLRILHAEPLPVELARALA